MIHRHLPHPPQRDWLVGGWRGGLVLIVCDVSRNGLKRNNAWEGERLLHSMFYASARFGRSAPHSVAWTSSRGPLQIWVWRGNTSTSTPSMSHHHADDSFPRTQWFRIIPFLQHQYRECAHASLHRHVCRWRSVPAVFTGRQAGGPERLRRSRRHVQVLQRHHRVPHAEALPA